MKAWVFSAGVFAGEVDMEPECGVDFCDICGDCLACYGGDDCYLAEHRWAVYLEDEGLERKETILRLLKGSK